MFGARGLTKIVKAKVLLIFVLFEKVLMRANHGSKLEKKRNKKKRIRNEKGRIVLETMCGARILSLLQVISE